MPEMEQDIERLRRDPPAVMTVEEAAAYLDLGVRTIYNLAGEGALPALKVAGSWRFPRAALDRWLEEEALDNRYLKPDKD
jgi:excisionase family DNA binding protein